MTIVILTGPLGVGKSWLQERLQVEHGFWSPMTFTTRQVAAHEAGLKACALAPFEEAVRERRLLMPARFADNWYAWPSHEVERMRNVDARVVVNVRPYTGLVLAALLPATVPCWLWIEEEELKRRRSGRGEERDVAGTRVARERADESDRRYEYLFAHRIRSDEGALAAIMTLITEAQGRVGRSS